jgi:hypothetical protein
MLSRQIRYRRRSGPGCRGNGNGGSAARATPRADPGSAGQALHSVSAILAEAGDVGGAGLIHAAARADGLSGFDQLGVDHGSSRRPAAMRHSESGGVHARSP